MAYKSKVVIYTINGRKIKRKHLELKLLVAATDVRTADGKKIKWRN